MTHIPQILMSAIVKAATEKQASKVVTQAAKFISRPLVSSVEKAMAKVMPTVRPKLQPGVVPQFRSDGGLNTMEKILSRRGGLYGAGKIPRHMVGRGPAAVREAGGYGSLPGGGRWASHGSASPIGEGRSFTLDQRKRVLNRIGINWGGVGNTGAVPAQVPVKDIPLSGTFAGHAPVTRPTVTGTTVNMPAEYNRVVAPIDAPTFTKATPPMTGTPAANDLAAFTGHAPATASPAAQWPPTPEIPKFTPAGNKFPAIGPETNPPVVAPDELKYFGAPANQPAVASGAAQAAAQGQAAQGAGHVSKGNIFSRHPLLTGLGVGLPAGFATRNFWPGEE